MTKNTRTVPIAPLGATPKQPERSKGKSRSSVYREAAAIVAADPALQEYVAMARGKKGFKSKTLAKYCNLPIWMRRGLETWHG